MADVRPPAITCPRCNKRVRRGWTREGAQVLIGFQPRRYGPWLPTTWHGRRVVAHRSEQLFAATGQWEWGYDLHDCSNMHPDDKAEHQLRHAFGMKASEYPNDKGQ